MPKGGMGELPDNWDTGEGQRRTSDRPSAWELGTGFLARPTRQAQAPLESPAEWLAALFPATFTAPLAPYHEEFWRWVWAIPASGPNPLTGTSTHVDVWSRGWAKSTMAEVAVLALAAHSRRRYGWYICSSQSQADDHLSTISTRILSSEVSRYYPDLAAARLEQVGDRSRQLGWRRNRVWTRDGFAIDALGLDSAVRGAKLGDQRPDFLILDDVDAELDSEGTIERKIAALTRRIIPAAAPGCVHIVAQNLVHPHGIVTRLVDGRATYLGSRTVSGPHPAIAGLVTEGTGTDAVIVAGEPTWAFMGLDVCQAKIRDAGLSSFLAECQHEITLMGAPRFDRDALALQRPRPPLPQSSLPEWAQDAYLQVWSLPLPGVPYVLYFDGAEGVGSDYCVSVVMRADSRQMVALLRDNRREQSAHAVVAARLARAYSAFVGWERSHEADFASVMAAEGITRVYEHAEEPTLAQRMNGTPGTTRRGYPARQRERRLLVARVARYVEYHEGEIPSEAVLQELQRFVVTARQPDGEAGSGDHDDTVFGLGGALVLSDHPMARRVEVVERGPASRRYLM